MSLKKLHSDEIAIDIHLVQRLITSQFPEWQHLPLKFLSSGGTDNVMYRLADDMVVRLPRVARSAPNIDKEMTWLPHLAPHVPISIPNPLVKGMPDKEYPFSWLILEWLEGANAYEEPLVDLKQAAMDLANFIKAVHKIDISGAPYADRGKPLSLVRGRATRDALDQLKEVINSKAATDIWEKSLAAPLWQGSPVWIHGDLQPANILVDRDKICAVIDFGLAGIGDPAVDLMVAWTLLDAESREIFRQMLGPDEATWQRGRGWALSFGVVAFSYYQKTNSLLAPIARRTIDEVLADV